MEKKKKIVIGVVAAVLVVAAVGAGIFMMMKKDGDKSNLVYVEKVASLTGDQLGSVNRYAGVIEAQDTWKINLDGDKEVNEVFVSAGDEIAEGDKLFSYKTDDVSDQIAQAKLEMESMNNEIGDKKAEIESLSAERDAAASEETRFDYSTQIQSAQNDLKQTEYDLKSKQLEINKLNETLEKSVVTSKMAGVVKSVANPNNLEDTSGAFMTILASGAYRVKCYINEQNMSTIAEGDPMVVRSRVDESQTWKGTLAGIDMEAPQSDSSGDEYMEESSDGSDVTSSSKYPFYISLEDHEGLMLGQHVFVEVDNGQDKERKGIWLFESYLVQEKDSAYVWVDNGKGKLEKRKVELGEYDEELGEYQIKSGLKKSEYIAWPQDGLKEGMKTTKDVSEAAESMNSGESGEGAMKDTGEEDLEEGYSQDEGEALDEGNPQEEEETSDEGDSQDEEETSDEGDSQDEEDLTQEDEGLKLRSLEGEE